MDYKLRPWQPADATLTDRLMRAVMGPILQEAWGPEYGEAAMLEMVRFVQEDEGETYVVEVGGQPVGLLGYSVVEGTMHLSTFVLDPSVQGQGLGQQLLAFCLEKAPVRQATRIEVWVQENNTRAIRFLAAAGFAYVQPAALNTVEYAREVAPLPW